jgi:hypothetical protein
MNGELTNSIELALIHLRLIFRFYIPLLLLFSLIGGISEGRASFSQTTYFKNHLALLGSDAALKSRGNFCFFMVLRVEGLAVL